MTEFLQNFHFLRPWLLLFLLLPLGLYLKKIKFSTASSAWEDICDAHLLKFLLVDDKGAKKTNVKKFIYTGLIFATLAAAGPTWKKEEMPTFTIENPNMFVISLAQDMQLKDIPPSRLDRAKFMLSDITDGLTDGQFGLEVYSHEPYIISPLTNDTKLIKSLLPQIVPDIVPDQGDRLDRAIDLALERFKTAGYTSGNIILFASDVGQRYDLALEKTKKAVANNYNIYVVDTSYSGNEKLKLLAEAGNGIYMNVQETSPQKILQRINTINQEKVTLSNNARSNFIDYGYYLIIIPLLCVLAFFRRGLLLLALCSFSTQAYAGFWQNDNQEGFSLFKNGQYNEALDKFTDANWRGISLYKQNKLEDALKEFEKSKNIETLYNKGVVLVKLCKYKEAAGVFDIVLQENPQHSDALYNKQVLVDLFEKSKTDPNVLECDNEQQNNQNQDNKQEQQQNNQQQDNNSTEQQEQQDSPQDNSEENNDTQQKQDNAKRQENSQSDGNTQSPQDDAKNKQDTEQNDSENDNEVNSENRQNSDEEPADSDNNQSPADKDSGSENVSENKNGEDNNGQEEQLTEQQVPLANAQKGNDDEKYDEEALAIQRRYREIPEDTGGLLREFIKKEYMKDRYKNEDM